MIFQQFNIISVNFSNQLNLPQIIFQISSKNMHVLKKKLLVFFIIINKFGQISVTTFK